MPSSAKQCQAAQESLSRVPTLQEPSTCESPLGGPSCTPCIPCQFSQVNPPSLYFHRVACSFGHLGIVSLRAAHASLMAHGVSMRAVCKQCRSWLSLVECWQALLVLQKKSIRWLEAEKTLLCCRLQRGLFKCAENQRKPHGHEASWLWEFWDSIK